MSLRIFFSILLFSSLMNLSAQPPSKTPQLEYPPQKKEGPKKTPPPIPKPPQRPSLNVSTIFSSPGIATLEGNEWVGTDHLYNLPPSIGIVVEIVKPTGVQPTPQSTTTTAATSPSVPGFNPAMLEDRIKEIVASSLRAAKIFPRDLLLERGSPLPFLHFLIILHPVEKGYVAYCAGRLFEAVQLSRIFLRTGITFQAITWEKQELLIAPPEQLQQQILETVQTITFSFTDRIKNYALEKPQSSN